MNKNYSGPDMGFIKDNHPEFFDLAKKFDDDGYVVIDIELKDQFIEKIIEDLKKLLLDKNLKKNPNYYHYNKFQRIIEAWKNSAAIKKLALNKKNSYFVRSFLSCQTFAFFNN